MLLSGLALAMESSGEATLLQSEMSTLQLVLTAIFFVELLLKAAVFPWLAFLNSGRQCFDAVVTISTVVLTILVYIPNGFNNAAAVRAMLSLRILRLFRLLLKVKSLEMVAVTFIKAMPAASKLLQTMALLMYLFDAVGVQLFGGVITTDNTSGLIISSEQVTFNKLEPATRYQTPMDTHPAHNTIVLKAAKLEASPFGQANYYPNNFNDMASGLVTLFELLVVNNWFVISSGYEAVLGSNVRWYFVFFYSVGVILGLNVCVAFVLDTYNSLEALDSLDDFISFDAAEITGTLTGLIGEYEATLRNLPFLHDHERRQQLIKLFTPAF